MARRGYVPTESELQAAIIDIAESRYGGLYAPGINSWDSFKPAGWATSATLARHFKREPHDAPSWPMTVEMLVGLAVAPPNSTVHKICNDQDARKSQPVKWLDDLGFSNGIACVSARSVPTGRGTYEVTYVLR